jgi:hypothetical protein
LRQQRLQDRAPFVARSFDPAKAPVQGIEMDHGQAEAFAELLGERGFSGATGADQQDFTHSDGGR